MVLSPLDRLRRHFSLKSTMCPTADYRANKTYFLITPSVAHSLRRVTGEYQYWDT